jgi:hypothetical protein
MIGGRHHDVNTAIGLGDCGVCVILVWLVAPGWRAKETKCWSGWKGLWGVVVFLGRRMECSIFARYPASRSLLLPPWQRL